MEVHPMLSYYNDVQDGTALVTNTLETTNHLTPLHIPPGPPILPARYEELRDTFQLCKPVFKAGQEYGGSEPLLPETHRNYEPPYTFDNEHKYYGSTGYAPLRLPRLPDNSPEDTRNLKYKLPPGVPGTLLVESRFHPFHPYVHTSEPDNVCTGGKPDRYDDGSKPLDIFKKLPPCAEQRGPIYDSNAPEFPKSSFKIPELNISARAANMLENVKKTLWLSSYKRDYTGTGSMVPLLLDDHDVKTIGRATGELGVNVDLRETFPAHTSQVRPLEGRIARLLQNRRPLLSGPREQEYSTSEMPPLQHTPDSVIRGFSEGVLSCGEVLPIPVQQCPNTENGTKRRNEYVAQKRPPWNKFQKITDTWKTESLYLRQLAVPPDPDSAPKPTKSIYYEDLKPSRLDKYIVWQHPVFLNKPASTDLNCRKHGNLQDLEFAPSPEDNPPRNLLPEWVPNCGVARPQTSLLDIQDFFTKTDTIKRLNDLTRGGMRDLRDHDRKGRRHKFYDFHAFFFH
ncbi:sperm-associated microtubule inner protein 4 [Heteronotia binoei]|uniref:sperm-associated microtubule inner protein 4 n=1 Tax=Heteronotia binoei TaxID=13085 RepID=UPI00292F21DD|nr:sperm-associated microtubule inner protein 4 [Heteronotia binoei]